MHVVPSWVQELLSMTLEFLTVYAQKKTIFHFVVFMCILSLGLGPLTDPLQKFVSDPFF